MSKTIFICHPWRGNKESHKDGNYPELTKKVCKHIAVNSDDIPLSTGLYLNQFLDDDLESERDLGIKLGHEMMEKCDEVYVYNMHGISDGMKKDLQVAEKLGKKIIEFEKYPWE